jgi:hypothetical protein
VLPEPIVQLLRALQQAGSCHLGGGAALSAAHLAHRLSGDLDVFCHHAQAHRELVHALPEVARSCGAVVELVRDAGHLVRARVTASGGHVVALDLVHEPNPDLDPALTIEEVVLESLADLRASKLTCILSRSEPRDLVDLLFLDRAGYPPERDLPLALHKDAGIDPGVLAWLLGQFPLRPLPLMLLPLTEEELGRFRDDLRERFRRASLPE